MLTSSPDLSFFQTPLIAHRFFNPPLTESLEQANLEQAVSVITNKSGYMKGGRREGCAHTVV